MLPISIQQLKEIKTPYYIYDAEGMRKAVRDLQSAFSWNEGFREYFAVKALPNPHVLSVLGEMGCGMDCATPVEILLCKLAGISGDRIMYSSNDTPASAFDLALESGAVINLDDPAHADILSSAPVCASCRWNPGDGFDMTNDIMGDLKEAKFGMTEEQVCEGLSKLRTMGVRRFGIHAMLSSNTLDGSYYPLLAKRLFEFAVRIKRRLGIALDFIDMSGGIGIPYKPGEQPVDIAAVGEGVRREYERILSPEGLKPAIYTELGRYITGPYGWLITRVLHVKKTYKTFVGVDASCANLMRPAMYGAYHEIEVLSGGRGEPGLCDVVGPLCENNDKFAIDRMLPGLEKGDLLAICDAGAHGHAMGYNYNGMLRCAEYLADNGRLTKIRRDETPEDIFATLHF